MTDHDKLVNTALNQAVKNAASVFVDELVSSTMLAVQQDPRAYGFVTLKEHDARVTELLEANNREVEHRRAAIGAKFLDLYPADTWHEDFGPVLWWKLPVSEAPWCGSPGDSDWPGYHTHWSHLPQVWNSETGRAATRQAEERSAA